MRYRITCLEASVLPAPDSPEMMIDWFIPRLFPWVYSAPGDFMYLVHTCNVLRPAAMCVRGIARVEEEGGEVVRIGLL